MNQQYCMHCMQPLQNSETACKACGYTPGASGPAHHLKSGTILKDKYLIGDALGDGGFGITYIGRDLTLDMRIAVKEYYPNGCANRSNIISNEVTMTHGSHGIDYEKDMKRFLSEARVLARFCNEPGVVGVRDFFRENGTAYIVMEYLDGITLKDHITTYGPIPAETFFRMIDPMLQVLGDIHKQGLIHRDISPDNIMMLKNGRLKLLDFGAAREVTGDKSLSVVLKPGYAPEEQYRSKGQQGPWTDVYAMCATIYKCITGITPDEAMQRVFEDELKPPSELGIAITAEQEMVILQGLSVKSSDRIQSMDDLRNALVAHESEDIRSIQIHRTDEEILPVIPGLGEKTEHQTNTEQTVYDPNAGKASAKAEGDMTVKQEQVDVESDTGVSTVYMPKDSTVKIPAGDIKTPTEDPNVTVAISHGEDEKTSDESDVKDIVNKDSDTFSNVPVIVGPTEVVVANLGQKNTTPNPNDKAIHNRQRLEFPYDEQVRPQKKKNVLRIAIGILAGIILIVLLLLFRACDQVAGDNVPGTSTSPSELQTQATTNTTEYGEQLEWSEWLDQLPDNVSAQEYDIEQKTLYSSRNLETTSSTETNSMDGWELFETVEANGEFGPWSDWSASQMDPSTTREVENQTRYRYRDKETTTGTSSSMGGWELYDTTYSWGDYGSWSNWSASSVSNSDSRQVETKTVYRYRSKETTTGSSANMSGWTVYDTTYSWGSYGAWSDWSTNAISGSNSRKVETKTQYRYRDISYSTEYTNWGNWSDWSFDRQSTSDLKKEESRTVWAYAYFLCPNCGAHMHGWGQCWTWAGGCGATTSDGHWHEVWSTTSWDQAGLKDWHGTGKYYTYIDGELVFKWPEGGSRTQYRYATRSTQEVANYGNWSDWGDTAYSNSSTCQVETRTVYRYCDRSQVATYHFYRWGSWSDWSDNGVTAANDRQVETGTFYRYRDRTQIATYHFYKWGNWSNWSTDVVSSTNDRQVEDTTFYRYRDQVKTETYYFRRWTDWTEYSDGVVTPSDTVEVQQKTQYRYKSKS